MECWHRSKAASLRAISLDYGNISGPWERGRLRRLRGGQPFTSASVQLAQTKAVKAAQRDKIGPGIRMNLVSAGDKHFI